MTYTWPASPLLLQPPDHETLCNLETIFRTTNTRPHTKNFTLLGRRVTVEATPSRYVFDFNDPEPGPGESSTLTTADPGKPYPHQSVTHRYRHPGSVQPRVDTIYTGRFRINNGPWRTISGTLTVRGTPVTLTVLEARPQLVS